MSRFGGKPDPRQLLENLTEPQQQAVTHTDGPLCVLAAAEDWAAADERDKRLQLLFEALAVETNPIPVKWALFEMGRVGPQIRLPLTPLEEAHRGPLRQCLETLGLIPA